MASRLDRLYFRGELLLGLVKREVLGRYRGSLFGVAWSLLSPLLMLGVYTLAFHELLGARWPGMQGRSGFAVMVFTGMLLHGLIAEVLVRSPVAVAGQPNYVKKMVFPLTVLPLVTVGASLFHAGLGLVILAAFAILGEPGLQWTTLLLPMILVPYLVQLAGLAWILAAIGVYVRDIAQLGGLLATVLLFLSPVFYPLSAIPPKYAGVIALNPLTFVVESARGLLFDGRLPAATEYVVYCLASVAFAALGLWVFRRLRPGFGDVL